MRPGALEPPSPATRQAGRCTRLVVVGLSSLLATSEASANQWHPSPLLPLLCAGHLGEQPGMAQSVVLGQTPESELDVEVSYVDPATCCNSGHI